MDWEEGLSTYSMPVESRTSDEILEDIERVTVELKRIAYNPVIKFKVGSELFRHIKENIATKKEDKVPGLGCIPFNGIPIFDATDELGPWGFKAVYENDKDDPGYWYKKRRELEKEYMETPMVNIKWKDPEEEMKSKWAEIVSGSK